MGLFIIKKKKTEIIPLKHNAAAKRATLTFKIKYNAACVGPKRLIVYESQFNL